MNASLQLKTQELIAAYLAESRKFDAEARRLEKLARNMKLMIEQGGIASDATAEVSEPLHQAQGVKNNGIDDAAGDQGFLALAAAVLMKAQNPMHIKEIVRLAGIKKGSPVTRTQIETAIVRGMKAGRYKENLKRTGPGTFEFVVSEL